MATIIPPSVLSFIRWIMFSGRFSGCCALQVERFIDPKRLNQDWYSFSNVTTFFHTDSVEHNLLLLPSVDFSFHLQQLGVLEEPQSLLCWAFHQRNTLQRLYWIITSEVGCNCNDLMFHCSFDPLVFLLVTSKIVSSDGMTTNGSLFQMVQFRAAKPSCHHLGHEDPTNMLEECYVSRSFSKEDIAAALCAQ